ncbi:MAG: chorismate-binding protein, partial [Burkholderiales bacterium]
MSPITLLQDGSPDRWLSFSQPHGVVSASRTEDVLPALGEIEEVVRTRGLWAVGYLSYEAGPAFDPALAAHAPGALPLLWYGLYPPPQVSATLPLAPSAHIPQYEWQPSVTKTAYDAAIARIRALIAAGDTYPVNYPLRLHSEPKETPEALFARMVEANKPRYSAYLDMGHFVICSASP